MVPIVEQLLRENEFDDQSVEDRKMALSALVMALRGVADTRVNYLELDRYNEDYGDRAQYDDAIVNIFTRLNTAGRTLTREDITFAWLKINWNTEATQGRGAKESVAELIDELKGYDLHIEPEDAISAVSFMWSAAFGGGSVLRNADLMRGERIGPMAEVVSANWNMFAKAISGVADIAHRRGLSYRDQYQSLNALSYLWALQFIGDSWKRSASLTENQRDSFDNQLIGIINEYIDRWLICSQWSGLWSRSTDVAVGSLANGLCGLSKGLSSKTLIGDAITLIRENLDKEVSAQVPEAKLYIETLAANRRNQVRTYRVPLWIWNRINSERWEASKCVLRNGTKRKPSVDVDHIIAYSLWERRIEDDGAPEDYTLEDLESAINSLGNCMLLEKNFNISKGANDLDTFMVGVHPYDNEPSKLPAWYEALNISESLRSRRDFSLKIRLEAIEDRTDSMRSELEGFILGDKTRLHLTE